MFDTPLVVTDKPLKKRTKIVHLLAAVLIWSMVVPLVFVHLSTFLYQEIYFSIYDIPKIRLKDYLILDRRKLGKLTFAQRMNCFYCEYANCILAWSKAIANQTEAYSCSIKHSVFKPGQEHQEEFHEYEKYV